MQIFERITSDVKVMGGQPCFRGLRMPVSMVLDSLADGMSVEEILLEWPVLEPEDIPAALRFAAALSRKEVMHAVQ